MSLCVIVRTAEEMALYWKTSSASAPSNVWTFHGGRCLYVHVEHLENVLQWKYQVEISVVGLDETGRQVVWTRPADAWEFHISLFDTTDADYLDDGIDPTH